MCLGFLNNTSSLFPSLVSQIGKNDFILFINVFLNHKILSGSFPTSIKKQLLYVSYIGAKKNNLDSYLCRILNFIFDFFRGARRKILKHILCC